MIFSFYSYKGGVGRTLAMVHTAIRLAATRRKKGYRILLIDLDLEAPGLHLYLPQTQSYYPSGFAGLLRGYLENKRNAGWIAENLENEDYIVPVKGTENLFFMPAGLWGRERQHSSSSYLDIITSLRQEFPPSGTPQRPTEGFFYDLQRALKDHFTYVFIDSRTGFADEAYASTILLADALVLCFRLNEANIEGIQSVFGNFLLREQKRAGDPALNIIPVAMSVPPRGGKDIEEWIALAAKSLGFDQQKRETERVWNYNSPFNDVSRILLESTLEVGERLVLKLSGEPEESYSTETPIVRSFYTLVDRLAALNADRDIISSEMLEMEYFRIKNIPEALEFWLKQIKLEPNADEHWQGLGERYASTELRYTAKDMLRRLIEEWRGDDSIERIKSNHDRSQQIARALYYYVRFYGKDEKDAGLARLEDALLLCQDNDLLENIEFLFGQAIDEIVKEREASESFMALHGRALSLEDACKHYTHAYELGKNNEEAASQAVRTSLIMRARDLNELGRYIEAIKDYDRWLLDYFPKSENKIRDLFLMPLFEQAEILEYLGYYAHAFQCFRLAFQSDFKHQHQHLMIDLLHLSDKLELFEFSGQITSEIERMEPGDVHTYITKARSYIVQKKYDKALENCHLINIYSGKYRTHFMESFIFILQGDYGRANETLKPIIEDLDELGEDMVYALYAYSLVRIGDINADKFIEENSASDDQLLWCIVGLAANRLDLSEEVLTGFEPDEESLERQTQYQILKLALEAASGRDTQKIWDILDTQFKQFSLLPVVMRNVPEIDLLHQTWEYMLDAGKLRKTYHTRLARLWKVLDAIPAPKLKDLPPRNVNEPIVLPG